MSQAIDIIERMFEYGDVSSAAALVSPWPGSPASANNTVRELQAKIRQMQATKLDSRSIATHPAIAELLPGGSLKQGASYSVESSTTLLMALLAGPSAAGSWCGVVGVPEFGVEAAAGFGIDLGRLVLVPHPGEHWLAVTSAIADVLTIVVARPSARVSDGSIARLAARIRQRGATMIVLGSWPQSEAMLSVSDSSWEGIGSGHGYLSARQVTVTVSTRSGGRPRSTRLWLPDAEQRFRPVSAYSGVAYSGATFSAPAAIDESFHEAAG
jgi:membrane protein implicated in regulation of membrane protease activity